MKGREGGPRLLRRKQFGAQIGIEADQRARRLRHFQRLPTDFKRGLAHRQGRAHQVEAAQSGE